jgi:hypothetical protein
MDYAVRRAADLSRFDVVMREVPTQANPLGVKGAGQAGCIGAPQTILAAILDAFHPLGVTHIDMPATPARIWGVPSVQVQALNTSARPFEDDLDAPRHKPARRQNGPAEPQAEERLNRSPRTPAGPGPFPD